MQATGHNQSLVNFIQNGRNIMAYGRLKAKEIRQTK
jgi:hypothetical protein